jgi:hypothetical protein
VNGRKALGELAADVVQSLVVSPRRLGCRALRHLAEHLQLSAEPRVSLKAKLLLLPARLGAGLVDPP